MLRTVIARRPHELDALAPLWQRLEPAGTMFQSYRWNRLAAQFFAEREAPCVVVVENDAGIALIPAAQRAAGLTLLGESLFDYRDVLSAGDPEVLGQAWSVLAAMDRGLAFDALRGETLERWSWLEAQPFVAAPQVRLADFDASGFAVAHTRAARLVRRLAQLGAEVRRYDGSATGLVRWIYQRKAEQPGTTTNLFADPLRVDFMVEICRLCGEACEVFTLESASDVVAALVTFRDGAVRRFYTTYHDHEWARHSPGIALLFEVTRRSLAGGLDCDYLTGEQPHKTRFATASVPLFRVHASAADLQQAAAERLPLAA